MLTKKEQRSSPRDDFMSETTNRKKGDLTEIMGFLLGREKSKKLFRGDKVVEGGVIVRKLNRKNLFLLEKAT